MTDNREEVSHKINHLAMKLYHYIQTDHDFRWCIFTTPATRILSEMRFVEEEIERLIRKEPHNQYLHDSLKGVQDCRKSFVKHTLPVERKQIKLARQECFRKLCCFWRKWNREKIKKILRRPSTKKIAKNVAKVVLNLVFVAFLVRWLPQQ